MKSLSLFLIILAFAGHSSALFPFIEWDGDIPDWRDCGQETPVIRISSTAVASSSSDSSSTTIAYNSSYVNGNDSAITSTIQVTRTIIQSGQFTPISETASESSNPSATTFSASPTGAAVSTVATTLTTKIISSQVSTPTTEATQFVGRGTYYQPDADACGTHSTSSDFVVAIGISLYKSADYCGKYMNASYNGKSVRVKVVDACASCSNQDLDFSPAAFAVMADLSVGVIQVSWSWEQ